MRMPLFLADAASTVLRIFYRGVETYPYASHTERVNDHSIVQSRAQMEVELNVHL